MSGICPVAAGGLLVVTNGIGDADKGLNSLTMRNSTLALFVDGDKTDEYVYVDQLTTVQRMPSVPVVLTATSAAIDSVIPETAT